MDLQILLQRQDLNVNAKAPRRRNLLDVYKDFALGFLFDYFLERSRYPDLDKIAELVLSHPRISAAHVQAGLLGAVERNDLAIASFIVKREKQRIDAERSRFVDIAKQSGIGMFLPPDVFDVCLVPLLGERDQTIITQKVFDAISNRSSDAQGGDSAIFKPMVDLLKDFLKEYGSVDEFDIPNVSI